MWINNFTGISQSPAWFYFWISFFFNLFLNHMPVVKIKKLSLMNVVYFPFKIELLGFSTSKQTLLLRKTQSLGFIPSCTGMFLVKVSLLSFPWFWLLPTLDYSQIYINLKSSIIPISSSPLLSSRPADLIFYMFISFTTPSSFSNQSPF